MTTAAAGKSCLILFSDLIRFYSGLKNSCFLYQLADDEIAEDDKSGHADIKADEAAPVSQAPVCPALDYGEWIRM